MDDDVTFWIEPKATMFGALMKVDAKQNWKWQQHKSRYERRYGVKKELPAGEFGQFEGVRFIG